MATIQSFEEIESWKKAREVCKILGELIDAGNFRRSYRLIHQIGGSSGSIMDNIAEGFERGSKGEFITFLGYSKGSCGEPRSQLYRAADRNFITQQEFEKLKEIVLQIGGLLQNFIGYLQKSEFAGIRRTSGVEKP
jgi:four helix bundle protein